MIQLKPSDAGGPYTPSIMVRGDLFFIKMGAPAYYREEGGGIYTNADTSVSGFRLIGANSSHTIGTGSSNGWLRFGDLRGEFNDYLLEN